MLGWRPGNNAAATQEESWGPASSVAVLSPRRHPWWHRVRWSHIVVHLPSPQVGVSPWAAGARRGAGNVVLCPGTAPLQPGRGRLRAGTPVAPGMTPGSAVCRTGCDLLGRGQVLGLGLPVSDRETEQEQLPPHRSSPSVRKMHLLLHDSLQIPPAALCCRRPAASAVQPTHRCPAPSGGSGPARAVAAVFPPVSGSDHKRLGPATSSAILGRRCHQPGRRGGGRGMAEPSCHSHLGQRGGPPPCPGEQPGVSEWKNPPQQS